MNMRLRTRTLLRLVAPVCLTASLSVACQQKTAPVQAAAPATGDAKPSTLEADVAHLKDITPSQSHSMIDVGYHMSNLWFAAHAENCSRSQTSTKTRA
jgi:hypothetical protein